LYITSGLYLNGQDEIIYLLQCNTNEHGEMIETQVPREILFHLMNIYDKSLNGQRVASMQHVFYDFDSAKIANEILNKNINSKHSIQAERMLLENKENMDAKVALIYCSCIPDPNTVPPVNIGILIHDKNIKDAGTRQ
jgi:hypothetical protein